jgi:hypothetical protein
MVTVQLGDQEINTLKARTAGRDALIIVRACDFHKLRIRVNSS